jgi:hypothetical protein
MGELRQWLWSGVELVKVRVPLSTEQEILDQYDPGTVSGDILREREPSAGRILVRSKT